MNDVQQRVEELRSRGWTDAAIADEIDYSRVSILRWRSGDQYPDHPSPILAALDGLLRRKRIPKQRRYAKGSRTRSVGST